MEDNLKEKHFEADIEDWLLTEGGYEHGYQFTYDKDSFRKKCKKQPKNLEKV